MLVPAVKEKMQLHPKKSYIQAAICTAQVKSSFVHVRKCPRNGTEVPREKSIS
jgi:hypothetical protein